MPECRPDVPGHAGGRESVTGDSIGVSRRDRLDQELGGSQDSKQVDADLISVGYRYVVSGLIESSEDTPSLDVLTKTAPPREVRKIPTVTRLLSSWKDR